jgi:hypothetical protein
MAREEPLPPVSAPCGDRGETLIPAAVGLLLPSPLPRHRLRAWPGGQSRLRRGTLVPLLTRVGAWSTLRSGRGVIVGCHGGRRTGLFRCLHAMGGGVVVARPGCRRHQCLWAAWDGPCSTAFAVAGGGGAVVVGGRPSSEEEGGAARWRAGLLGGRWARCATALCSFASRIWDRRAWICRWWCDGVLLAVLAQERWRWWLKSRTMRAGGRQAGGDEILRRGGMVWLAGQGECEGGCFGELAGWI